MPLNFEGKIIDQEKYNQMVHKVGEDIMVIFKQLKEELGGRLPAEFTYGIVAGYLRGKGYSWEECFCGMERFINVAEKFASPKVVEGPFKISGNGDGTVKCDLKEK